MIHVQKDKTVHRYFFIAILNKLLSGILLKMSAEMFFTVKNADAVCFDVDSTIIREEGLDELAKFYGKGSEVADLTCQAMTGIISHRESLQIRLDIIRPSLAQVEDFLRKRPPTFTPGVKKFVNILHNRNIPIYLVSGGLRDIIDPIADELNIPRENIFANRLKFYFDGEFAGFDEHEPIYEAGNKRVIIQYLKEKYRYRNLVLIGDGPTELEACPPADAFIAYGGNVVRQAVKEKAKWFITDFNDIINIFTNSS